MTAHLLTQSWAGLSTIPVEVVGETAKYYRVKLLKDAKLPGRNRFGKVGEVILAPKGAVRFDQPPTGG